MPKGIVLSSALALGIVFGTINLATAAPITTTIGAVSILGGETVLPVEKVRHRNYRHHRHGPRYRSRRGRHRHYYRGWWYAYPWWLHAVPHSYGRCNYWHRECRRRWGGGRDYRGCMRHHGCRP